ncbi:MAG: hypothetical protein JWM44_740 [Bacilli bacterium]|nr:hypothetical protein [Bacilli bacterium]
MILVLSRALFIHPNIRVHICTRTRSYDEPPNVKNIKEVFLLFEKNQTDQNNNLEEVHKQSALNQIEKWMKELEEDDEKKIFEEENHKN